MSSPNTDNYTLGKGVVYFNRYDFTNSKYTGERDLGNAPAFSFNVSLEKLEHYSSRGGLRAKDKNIISQITPGVQFTLDEVTADNLSLLVLADIETVTQTSLAITNEAAVAYKGKRIQLAYRGISLLTVTGTGAKSATTYVQGTDYIVDTTLKDDKIGRIFIPNTSSIADGDNIEIDYTRASVTYKKIKAFAQTQVEGFLRFVSDNPAGTQQELQIWRCSLTPTGDTALIGEDWSTLGFTGEILKDATGHPTSPYFNIIMD
jgi:hypothetical protein